MRHKSFNISFNRDDRKTLIRDILIIFLDNVTMRGERLELLVNKTENLSNNVSKHINIFTKSNVNVTYNIK